MKCPACNRTLARRKVGSIQLDVCLGGCGGIWFDADELNRVNEEQPNRDEQILEIAHDPALQTADDAHERPCPHCTGQRMDRRLFSLGTGVVLDRCPQCDGVWLDAGELEKIRSTLKPGGAGSSAKRIHVGVEVIRYVYNLKINIKPAARRRD